MDKSQSQPKTTQPAAAEAVSTWPGAFGAYKPSGQAVRLNLNAFLLLWALSLVGGMLIGAVFGHQRLLANLLSTLLGAFTAAALFYVTLASVRGKTVEFAESIRVAWPRFLWLFVLQLLVGITVIGGLILFIVPGLYFAVRLCMAGYFFMDKDLGVVEAYKASWAATKGNAGKVWGLVGVSFLMILPVITIIGVVATIYLLFMYQASTALLYLHLQHQKVAPKE